MTKAELLARLRFEVPVEIDTSLDRDTAVRQLRAIVRTTDGWKFWELFDGKAIRGFVEQRGGEVCFQDVAFYPMARFLVFRFEDAGTVTRLTGVLRLRLFLQFYGASVLLAMVVLMAWMTVMSLKSGGPGLVDTLLIFPELLLIPFIWLYARLCIWLGRKKEAELLRLVRKALEPIPEKSATLPRLPEPPSPTEIFIRPRHETPEA